MSKIFVTSDLHLGHNREFMYGRRGFTNIEEHDEALVDIWNRTVSDTDVVYILGDLMLGDNTHGYQMMNQLQGHKLLIRGNHDTVQRWNTIYPLIGNSEQLGLAALLTYHKYHFYLSHYPTITAQVDDEPFKKSLINLCGHSHTTDKWADWDKGIIYHCELDAHQMCPVSLDDIIEDLRAKSTIHLEGHYDFI